MNERIRELAEQARAEEYSGWLGGKPATTVTLDELERFAQLIVQECISAVHDDGQDAEYYQNRIKTHFGVEQ